MIPLNNFLPKNMPQFKTNEDMMKEKKFSGKRKRETNDTA